MPGLGDICMREAARRDTSLNSTLLVCPECNGNTLPSSDPDACDWCLGAGVLEEALVGAWEEWSAEAAPEWESGLQSGRWNAHDEYERELIWRAPGTRLRVFTYWNVLRQCYQTDVERLTDSGRWESMTRGGGFWAITGEGALHYHCWAYQMACERWGRVAA